MADRRSPSERRKLTVRIAPPPYCPGCIAKLDAATCIDLNGAHPQRGSLCICWYCSAVLEFHGAPLRLRRLEGDELNVALADPKVKKARLAIIMKNATRDG